MVKVEPIDQESGSVYIKKPPGRNPEGASDSATAGPTGDDVDTLQSCALIVKKCIVFLYKQFLH